MPSDASMETSLRDLPNAAMLFLCVCPPTCAFGENRLGNLAQGVLCVLPVSGASSTDRGIVCVRHEHMCDMYACSHARRNKRCQRYNIYERYIGGS